MRWGDTAHSSLSSSAPEKCESPAYRRVAPADTILQALTGVLRANFLNFGQAALKIDRREFVIQDAVTRRDINLDQRWDGCFYPGQRVDMSMTFPIGGRPVGDNYASCAASPNVTWTEEREP